MRSICLGLVVLLASCAADDTVGKDTTYRRLIDGFATESQCLAQKAFTVCYQTLTLCPDGSVLMDLENHLEEGSYHLDGKMAVAAFLTRTVEFDLRTASSPQLPGDNAWEQVTPTITGCQH